MTTQTTTPEASPVKWTVVLAVVLTAVLEVLDTTIINVALPQMKAAFGITTTQTTWILTSYIVASVVVMPLTGFFARMFGRRRLITTAILGFAGFSALAGLSWSIETIVLFRIGQGLFGAFLIPLSQSILFDSFPREKRGQAMALFGMGVVVAPILGPTLGAILTEAFSWRAVFYVNMPIALFALLMISGELKKDEVKTVTIDWVGLALMVCAVAGLQLLLDLGEDRDWFASHLIQVALVVFVCCGASFVWRGLKINDNIIDFSLFRDRSFSAANAAMMGFGLAMYGTISILPLFVQGLLGYGVMDAGYLFIPRGLAAGITMVLTGNILLKHFDPRLLVAVGLTMTGMGSMALSWLNLEANFWQLSMPGVVSGIGMGLFFVPMSTVAFQHTSGHKQDEASGIYGVVRSIGSSMGIAIVGWQVARRIQIHWTTLAEQITPYNPHAIDYLKPLSLTPDSPAGAAQLTALISEQAQMLAYQDVFMLTGWAAFAMLPVVLLMQRPQSGSEAAVGH
jgi:DHA2 family multidrug resistance protein